jgi:Flp pilus assembly protein TadD
MIHAVCFGGSLLAYGVTSNLVVLSTISFSERALYLPSAFLVLGLGWLIQGWLRQGEKISAPGMILVGSVILCLSGLSLMRVTDYASNQAIANTSLEHTPRSARLWSMLGESLREEGRFDDADRAYRQALLFDPDSASAFRGRGLVAFARKRYQQAAQWHDRAIDKSQGGMVDAYNDACLAYLRANDFDRALRRCNAGLSRAPNENLLMTNVSRVYLAQGNLKTARKWAQKGYERSPQNFYSLWHLLLVTLKSGDENHAKVLWNRAKKQKPGDQKLLQFGQQFGLE